MKNQIRFVTEKSEHERVFLFHFNTDIHDLLLRISKKEDIHSTSPMSGESIKIAELYKPVNGLVGIENVRPMSRYTLAFQFGKAFDYTTIMRSILGMLEIDYDEDDWVSWFSNLEESYPNALKTHMELKSIIKPDSAIKSIAKKDMGFKRLT